LGKNVEGSEKEVLTLFGSSNRGSLIRVEKRGRDTFQKSFLRSPEKIQYTSDHKSLSKIHKGRGKTLKNPEKALAEKNPLRPYEKEVYC